MEICSFEFRRDVVRRNRATLDPLSSGENVESDVASTSHKTSQPVIVPAISSLSSGIGEAWMTGRAARLEWPPSKLLLVAIEKRGE